MFRKISSAAAADAHSFSSLASPLTRPPKPPPLNSRNSRSLLQMFRKNSSAPADAHSLSSPFTLPPMPTPLNYRNSTSPFTFPAGATSAFPDESFYGPTIWLSRRRLQKTLQTICTASDVSADVAFNFYVCTVPVGSRSMSRLYLFNVLLRGLAEKERYDDVLWLYSEMGLPGLIPDFVTLNILLKCLCLANRVSDGFLVMGRILRMGYMPNSETLNSLFEGLIIGDRVDDAVRMYWTLHEICDCFPDLTTGSILRRVLLAGRGRGRGRRGIKGDIHTKELNLGIGSGDNVINPI